MAHSGDTSGAGATLARSLEGQFWSARFESLVEAADVHSPYGDATEARRLLDDAARVQAPNPRQRLFHDLVNGEHLVREGDPKAALSMLDTIAHGTPTGYPGFYVRLELARVHARVRLGCLSREDAEKAERRARQQGAEAVLPLLHGLIAVAWDKAAHLDSRIMRLAETEPALVTTFAEAILDRSDSLSESTMSELARVAQVFPERWRHAARCSIADPAPSVQAKAGLLLEAVGDRSDVARLRELSRQLRAPFANPDLGRKLARRVADRVVVEDLGRVSVHVGSRTISGSSIRRKALALLCFLVSQRGFAASRDQVLEAMWPEFEPDQALNSLHQTAYFLRRVFEQPFSEDTSPGYLRT